MEAEETGATNKEPAKDTSPHLTFHSDKCVRSANTQEKSIQTSNLHGVSVVKVSCPHHIKYYKIAL